MCLERQCQTLDYASQQAACLAHWQCLVQHWMQGELGHMRGKAGEGISWKSQSRPSRVSGPLPFAALPRRFSASNFNAVDEVLEGAGAYFPAVPMPDSITLYNTAGCTSCTLAAPGKAARHQL